MQTNEKLHTCKQYNMQRKCKAISQYGTITRQYMQLMTSVICTDSKHTYRYTHIVTSRIEKITLRNIRK